MRWRTGARTEALRSARNGELVAAVSSYEAGAANDKAPPGPRRACFAVLGTSGITTPRRASARPRRSTRRSVYHVWEDGGDVVVSLDPRPG